MELILKEGDVRAIVLAWAKEKFPDSGFNDAIMGSHYSSEYIKLIVRDGKEE